MPKIFNLKTKKWELVDKETFDIELMKRYKETEENIKNGETLSFNSAKKAIEYLNA